MKLNTNKTFMKRSRTKIRNQNNKDWSLNTNNKDGQTVIFTRKERNKEKIKTRQRQTELPTSTSTISNGRGHCDASNDKMIEQFWMSRGAAYVTSAARTSRWCTCTPPSLFFCFYFLFSQIQNFSELTW